MVLSIAYSMLIPVDMTETVSLQNAGPCPAILSGLVALTYTYKKMYLFPSTDACSANWNVSASSGVGRINVTWKPLNNEILQNRYISAYLIVYRALNNSYSTNSDIQTINDTISTSATMNYLLTDTLYSLQLFAFLSSENGQSTICSTKVLAKTEKGTM